MDGQNAPPRRFITRRKLLHAALIGLLVAFTLLARRERAEAERARRRVEAKRSSLAPGVDALEVTLEEERKRLATATKKLSDNELMLAMLRDKGVQVEVLLRVPDARIDGEVALIRSLGARPEHDAILLSVGRRHGVATGRAFYVYRGARFIGRARAVTVWPDLTACEVLFIASGARAIEAGDEVTTWAR